jgi:hypothetical protein
MDNVTKSNVRSSQAYARHCMRLVDQALTANDLEELEVLANEILGAVSTLHQYIEDKQREEQA